jgi:DNA-binding beta-propeller fold protein YncE
VFLADRNNQLIRKVSPSPPMPAGDGNVDGDPDELIQTVAGNGYQDFCGDTGVAISDSCLDDASDVSLDVEGNIYIADPGNHRVRWIDVNDAHIYPLAGKTEQTDCADDGEDAADLCLANPRELVVSPDNDRLYVSDRDGNKIWRIALATGLVRRIAGAADGTPGGCADESDSRDAAGCLYQPRGLDVLQSGGGTDQYLYVAQQGSTRVSRIDLINETIRTVHDDGQVPTDVALGPDGALYVAQPLARQIVRVDPGPNGIVEGQAFDNTESSAVVAGDGSVGLPTDGMVATAAPLSAPSGVEVDGDGHILISDAGSHTIWVVDGGRIYRIAGAEDGTPGFCGDPDPGAHNAREACLNAPTGLFYHDLGTAAQQQLALYFADEGNDRIRKIPSDCDGDGLLDMEEASLTWKGGTVVTNECSDDTDGDGCTDAQEVGLDQNDGGRRNPTNPNDYFNPTGDRQNRIDDVLAVITQYFDDDDDGNPGLPPYAAGYDPDTDRTALGPNQWNLGPPNGEQRIDDVLAIIYQYFHDCA